VGLLLLVLPQEVAARSPFVPRSSAAGGRDAADYDPHEVRYVQNPETGRFEGSLARVIESGEVSNEDLLETEERAKAGVKAATEELLAKGVKPLPGSEGLHPNTIPTRRITSIKELKKFEGGEQSYMQPSIEGMAAATLKSKSSPGLTVFEHNISLLNDRFVYPNMRPSDLKGSAHEVARNFIEHVKSNLRFLYEHSVDKFPSRFWYDGARVIVDRQAQRYGFNESSIAGVYAALSPQMDWDQNVYHGDRLLEIYKTQQDTRWSDAMSKTANRIWSKERLKAISAAGLRKKTLAECETPAEKGMWIRTFNEAHDNRHYRTVLPTGDYGPMARNKPTVKKGEVIPGVLSTARPPALPALTAAVMALEANGDRATISRAMGEQHKVRSFYNNILDPHSANGDITSDTHHVGAGLLRDLGGKSYATYQNFGTGPERLEQAKMSDEEDAAKKLGEQIGTPLIAKWRGTGGSAETGSVGLYGLYATATRELAKELNIEPRQLQSIVWVTKRTAMKDLTDKKHDAVEVAWQEYYVGHATLQQTQNAIWEIIHG
jgi:hypothetical protein